MMNTTTTLKDAHREWARRPSDQRFQTLGELREAVHNRRMRSVAHDAPLQSLAAIDNGGTLLLRNGREMTPTHWGMGQLCGLVKAPASFVRNLPTDLVVGVLNNCISKAPKNDFKLMAIKDDSGEKPATLQAITSTSYGRIWDADVVDAVGRIVERTNGKFHNPLAYSPATGQPVPSGLYASDRDVFIFMIDGGSLLEAGPRAKFNRGFFVSNSEVGNCDFRLTTFLFNTVCGNHYVWGATDVKELRVIHSQGGPARFDRCAVPALMDYTASTPQLTAVKRAQETPLRKLPLAGYNPETDNEKVWLKAFGARFNFTGGEVADAMDVARREEGQCETVWDMVQGLTASARELEYIDARVDMERRAGAVLDTL